MLLFACLLILLSASLMTSRRESSRLCSLILCSGPENQKEMTDEARLINSHADPQRHFCRQSKRFHKKNDQNFQSPSSRLRGFRGCDVSF